AVVADRSVPLQIGCSAGFLPGRPPPFARPRLSLRPVVRPAQTPDGPVPRPVSPGRVGSQSFPEVSSRVAVAADAPARKRFEPDPGPTRRKKCVLPIRRVPSASFRPLDEGRPPRQTRPEVAFSALRLPETAR